MNNDHTYTLAELAEETGLTERTVRYYIEQVLPSHHKQGRGKLARYGQDTLNCIRFILLVRERYGFKPGQAKGVLADVPQETIDRVVRGEEEVAVMTVPLAPASMKTRHVSSMSPSSARMAKYKARDRGVVESAGSLRDHPDIMKVAEEIQPSPRLEISQSIDFSASESVDPWRTVFADSQVRIQCRGKHKLTPHQEEQLEAAARLIELALR